MGGFGGFNVDIDMDEILRLQEEEARRQQEAAAQGDYASMFADWNTGDRAAWEAYSPAGTTLTNFEMFSPGGYGPLQGPEGETWQEAAARATEALNPRGAGFMDWQGQVAPGALERNSDLTNWQLANQGGWIQPQINYPSDSLSLGDKQTWNSLNSDEQAAARAFLANLAPAPASGIAGAASGIAGAGAGAAGAGAGAGIAAPAPVDWYQQTTPQGVLDAYGTDAAVFGDLSVDQQAWLDAAIAGGSFQGDLGEVPFDQTVLTEDWDPDAAYTQQMVDDPRLQKRIDFADSLLQQGYTVADIEQFLGMESLLTSDELGTVEGERLDSFEGVGSDQWFDFLEGEGVEVLDEHRSTLPWMDSPEFKAEYGDPGGAKVEDPLVCGDNEHEENGVCVANTPGLVCQPGQHEEGGRCVDDAAPDEVGFDGTPDGVPTFVAAQVDELNIINTRLKSITDAHKKLLNSGIGEIDAIEEALTLAESEIYESQYGAIDPLTGEVLTPGEMDRLLTTFENRRKTTKSNRTTDRAEILSIMTDEGVPAGLAESELDMIQAIHGDSIDAQYDYIESLWRIGKLSHDERTSMIGNMIASYKLQLRDTVVEMLMAEEVHTADAVAGAQQDALRSRNMAGMFKNATEDEVYALMSSGMTDLLQLPADKEIGMIEAGEWAGYTQGQKSNVLTTAGWTQNTDGTFVAPAATGNDKVLSKLMPDGTTFSGTAAEYFAQTGERIFAAGDEEITQDLPDGTSFTGTVADYVARSGVYPFAAAAEQNDPNTFTVSVDRINELDPTGAWLQGQVAAENLTIIGARPDRREAEGTSGFVTMDWDDWIFEEEPYEAAFESITMDLPDGTPFTGTAQEYFEKSGEYPFAAPEEVEAKKYRMNASELTDRGISLEDFEVVGGTVPGSESWVMISPEKFADLTGEYMFPASPEADPGWMTDVFPSGVMVADVPGLTSFDTTPDGTEYLMSPDALGTFGPLQSAVDAEREVEAERARQAAAGAQQKNIKDIALELPITGIYQAIETEVQKMRTTKIPDSDKKWEDMVEAETLWLLVIEQGARSDEGYAKIWANYTGNNVAVDRVWNENQQAWFSTSPVVVVEPDSEYRR